MAEADKFSYKNCRKRTNLTQREVCDRLNIAEIATLSNYETGKVIPPDTVVKGMAALYGEMNLIIYHLRRVHPDFAEYIPYPANIGDIQKTLAKTYLSSYRINDMTTGLIKFLKR